jgi:hypothetical protein
MVSVAQSISITDFRIPLSKYQRLLGSLNGQYNTSSSEYSYVAPLNSEYTNANLSNSFSYLLGQFSEDRSLEINGYISSQYSSSDNSRDDRSAQSYGEGSSMLASTYINPFIRYSDYLQPDTWFLTVQAQGNGQYSYGHTKERERNPSLDTTWSDFNRTKNYQYSASAGIGYGKLRDGQSIFAALRVLDKLQDDSALVRSLTREEILTLADYFARRSEYAYSQDRYSKFIMEDMVKTLDSMGVIKGGAASAFEVMRAFEVIQYERIEPRLFGWRVSASIMRSASQNNDEGSRSTTFYTNSMEYLQLQSDYGYPMSLNTQLSASGAVLLPRKDSRRRIGVALSGNLTYQVTDRIDAIMAYSLNRTSESLANDDSENFRRDLTHQVNLNVRFFIENDVAFTVSGGYLYQKSDTFFPVPAGYSNTYSSTTASFGLTYRFF